MEMTWEMTSMSTQMTPLDEGKESQVRTEQEEDVPQGEQWAPWTKRAPSEEPRDPHRTGGSMRKRRLQKKGGTRQR